MPKSKYIPVNNKVLVKFTKPKRDIVIPENVGDPVPDIRVIEAAHELDMFAPGDKILTRPDVNILTLETNDDFALCLIDASAIVAIVYEPEVALES